MAKFIHKHRHTIIVAVVVLLFGLGLHAMTGCGTVRGIGEDIMRTSDGVRDAMTDQ